MSTVYTYNNKVLKNSANDKWLAKKEAPAGFVMNASNATYVERSTGYYWVFWQSPSYPDTYNGNGKQYTLVNNNSTVPSNPLLYGNAAGDGPPAISVDGMAVLGTSTGVLLNNVAGGTMGINLVWPYPVQGYTLEQLQAYMANVTITIVDP